MQGLADWAQALLNGLAANQSATAEIPPWARGIPSAPPTTATPTLKQPNNYDFFRSFYPPDTRPMPESGGLGSPGTAPMPGNPIPPANYVRPEMDANRNTAAPDLPPGQLPWLTFAKNYMTEGGTASPPLTLRINKPNVAPAGDPPPYTPDTLPLINSAQPAGLGQIEKPEAPAQPDLWFDRNANFGKNAGLWQTISALGSAMATSKEPRFLGALGEGVAAGNKAATEFPMRQLAQAKGEAETGNLNLQLAQRRSLLEMAGNAKSPQAKMALMAAAMSSDGRVWEKLVDPNARVVYDPEKRDFVLNPNYQEAVRAESGNKKQGEIDIEKGSSPQAKLAADLARAEKDGDTARATAIRNEIAKQEAERKAAEATARSSQGKVDELGLARQSIESVYGQIFNKDGTLNRQIVLEMQSGLPGSKGRQLAQELQSAINNYVFLKSGAAVPEAEWARFNKLYFPSVLDGSEGARSKMQRLIQSLDLYGREGGTTNPAAKPDAKPEDGPESKIVAGPNGKQAFARRAPDGNYYVPDPARPGKYLRVE